MLDRENIFLHFANYARKHVVRVSGSLLNNGITASSFEQNDDICFNVGPWCRINRCFTECNAWRTKTRWM